MSNAKPKCVKLFFRDTEIEMGRHYVWEMGSFSGKWASLNTEWKADMTILQKSINIFFLPLAASCVFLWVKPTQAPCLPKRQLGCSLNIKTPGATCTFMKHINLCHWFDWFKPPTYFRSNGGKMYSLSWIIISLISTSLTVTNTSEQLSQCLYREKLVIPYEKKKIRFSGGRLTCQND